jgi:hypothetical protein
MFEPLHMWPTSINTGIGGTSVAGQNLLITLGTVNATEGKWHDHKASYLDEEQPLL